MAFGPRFEWRNSTPDGTGSGLGRSSGLRSTTTTSFAERGQALYTDDGYYLSAHILAHGRQAIEAYWERGIKAGGHIDFIKPLTLYYIGDLAYCAGTYQATNAGVTVDGRTLIVLRRVNGRWLIAAHETVVRDQPL
jgi:ketosteroid isomerase-like protein